MVDELNPFEELPDAWRRNVHGISMSRDEYELSCEIERDIKLNEAASIISAIVIGRKLISFKEKLGHGRFGVWRRCRFGEKDRTCQRNMLMARHFGTCPDAVSHLPLSLMREALEKKNWPIIEHQIKSDIEEGKPLDASEIRASLPARSHLSRLKKLPKPVPESEEDVISIIVNSIRAYDKSVLSIIRQMDQGRLGEMIIERVLTGT